MIAVNINQVSKKYGRKLGISGINLVVEEGDIFGIVGPDGAGKSSILRILMNYVFPSDGDAEVFDMDVVDETKSVKKVTAYAPSEVYFYNRMKAGKYINYTIKSRRHKKNDYYNELLRLFEIDVKDRFDVMDRSDQKKMALTAALAAEPKLLLLDEPCRGLDATFKNRLFEQLKEIQSEGTTVMITSRDADELMGLCNKIIILENGEITVDAETFAAENPEYFTGQVQRFSRQNQEDAEEYDGEIAAADEMMTPADAFADTIVIIPEENDEANTSEIDDDFLPPEVKNELTPEDTTIGAAIKKAAANKHHDSTDRPKNYKNITMKSIGFQRQAFTDIGAKIVEESAGKIVIEYSGDLDVLAKLLYDLNMDDICISNKELQEVFLPFYEGGEQG